MPCSRTQHGLTRVGLEPPTSGSGVRGINHQATALPTYAIWSIVLTDVNDLLPTGVLFGVGPRLDTSNLDVDDSCLGVSVVKIFNIRNIKLTCLCNIL